MPPVGDSLTTYKKSSNEPLDKLKILYSDTEVELILESAKYSRESKLSKSQEKLVKISEHIYLFQEMHEDEILSVTKNVRFKKFAQGDIILQKGDNSKNIFFILAGKVSAIIPSQTKEAKIVGNIDSGQMFGEMAFARKKPRSATVMANEDTTVLIFEINEKKCNRAFCYPFVLLYKNIAYSLANKLDVLNDRV